MRVQHVALVRIQRAPLLIVGGDATLEARLDPLLAGLNLSYPIRTRAKVAKQRVAEALGYPVPSSFAKVQPRFPGQNVDVSVQMSNNFQVWNEEIEPGRRYVFIRVDSEGVVTKVRVLTGEAVALFDTTGTLTSKFQAKRRAGLTGSKLVSESDTEGFVAALRPRPDVPAVVLSGLSPTARPRPSLVLPIETLLLAAQVEVHARRVSGRARRCPQVCLADREDRVHPLRVVAGDVADRDVGARLQVDREIGTVTRGDVLLLVDEGEA